MGHRPSVLLLLGSDSGLRSVTSTLLQEGRAIVDEY